MSKVKVFATTLLLAGFSLIDTAAAGFFKINPAPPSGPPANAPELDGSGALAVLALVASIGAVLMAKSKSSDR